MNDDNFGSGGWSLDRPDSPEQNAKRHTEVLQRLVNARKPSSTQFGRSFLETMNTGHHAELAEWGMPHLRFNDDFVCLDLGCGGGANVARMLEYCPNGKVVGIDYSQASVEFTSEVNQEAIDEGRCEVVTGDVAELPFDDCTFDVVTAYESVYFWPEPKQVFDEVFRVCKPGGSFMICNEADGTTLRSAVWDGVAGHMKIYNFRELANLMRNAGFNVSCIDHMAKRGWIAVAGTRPRS